MRVHAAAAAPLDELRDIDAAAAGLGAVNPPLRPPEAVGQLPLGEAGLLAEAPKQAGHVAISAGVVGLNGHDGMLVASRLESICASAHPVSDATGLRNERRTPLALHDGTGRMSLYELTRDTLTRLSRTTFAEQGFKERADLQRLLRDDIAVIDPDLLVIAEEFRDWDESQRRIDLLAVDRGANLVVIELKRDERGGHMELQALRYAAMVANLEFEDAVAQLAKLRGWLAAEAERSILEFLGWESPVDGGFAADVRIILIAADFSNELCGTVLWLNDRDLDIRCVRLQPHELADRVVLDVESIVPLPEASAYAQKRKQKAQADRHARREPRVWTGYYFVNVGERDDLDRSWEDCRKYGFLRVGGGREWSDQIAPIQVGDLVLAYLNGHGYVGLGRVTQTATLASRFTLDGGERLIDQPLEGGFEVIAPDDEENGEYCLGVAWEIAVPREHGVCSHLSMRKAACRLMQQGRVDEIVRALNEGVEQG